MRTWRGWTRPENTDAYADYTLSTGIVEYRATPGNQGAYIVSRQDGDRTEFYPEDDRYLIDRETTVRHFTVH